MKKLLLVFIVAVGIFVLSSCGYQSSDITDLISLPSPYKLEDRILAKLTEVEADDVSLIYAKRGEYQNSINFFDIDSDGSDEIIVFYRSVKAHSSSGDTANIHIFKYDDKGEIYSLFDIYGDGSSIDKIAFTDFDADGYYDLTVGYVSSYNTTKLFYIYEIDYTAGRIVTSLSRRYSDFVNIDIDSDGKTEIVSSYFNDIDREAYSSVYRYFPSYLGVREDTDAGCKIAYSQNVFFMKSFVADNGANSIIITARLSSMLTSNQILVWNAEANTLKNVSFVDQNIDGSEVISSVFKDSVYDGYFISDSSKNLNRDYCSLGNYVCCDIDGDGSLDIPLCRYFDEGTASESLTSWKEALLYLYTWCTFDGEDLSEKFEAYINEDQGYIFKIRDIIAFENIKAYIDYKSDMYFYYVPYEEATYPILGIDNRTLLFYITMTESKPVEDSTHMLLYYSPAREMYYTLIIGSKASDEVLPDLSLLKNAFLPAISSVAN